MSRFDLVVMPEWKNKVFRAVAWLLGFHKEDIWVITTTKETPTEEVK